MPGGTYWFTSLTISNQLSFSGAATLIVNGDVNLSSSLYAYNESLGSADTGASTGTVTITQ